jgi:hypothetical protein
MQERLTCSGCVGVSTSQLVPPPSAYSTVWLFALAHLRMVDNSWRNKHQLAIGVCPLVRFDSGGGGGGVPLFAVLLA